MYIVRHLFKKLANLNVQVSTYKVKRPLRCHRQPGTRRHA